MKEERLHFGFDDEPAFAEHRLMAQQEQKKPDATPELPDIKEVQEKLPGYIEKLKSNDPTGYKNLQHIVADAIKNDAKIQIDEMERMADKLHRFITSLGDIDAKQMDTMLASLQERAKVDQEGALKILMDADLISLKSYSELVFEAGQQSVQASDERGIESRGSATASVEDPSPLAQQIIETREEYYSMVRNRREGNNNNPAYREKQKSLLRDYYKKRGALEHATGLSWPDVLRHIEERKGRRPQEIHREIDSFGESKQKGRDRRAENLQAWYRYRNDPYSARVARQADNIAAADGLMGWDGPLAERTDSVGPRFKDTYSGRVVDEKLRMLQGQADADSPGNKPMEEASDSAKSEAEQSVEEMRRRAYEMTKRENGMTYEQRRALSKLLPSGRYIKKQWSGFLDIHDNAVVVNSAKKEVHVIGPDGKEIKSYHKRDLTDEQFKKHIESKHPRKRDEDPNGILGKESIIA